MSGEADMYMPSKLMDQDVVVVVLQYRLGTLGKILIIAITIPLGGWVLSKLCG